MPNLKNVNWLLVAGIATIAYVFVLVGWLGLDRILIYPTNNSLNEVGDFIAGVFSPLAFIWLVAAVLTQRQELTETRDQFAENQKVVDAQLKTINEQSDLLQQQHALAEETAKKTYRLSLFDERYKIYSDFLAFGKKHSSWTNLEAAYLEFEDLIQRARFVFGDDICDWFGEISDGMYEVVQLRQTPKIPAVSSFGRSIMKFDDETQIAINGRRSWLTDQFRLPMERDRFYNSMRISDN
ncbi:hypothetical protein G6L13_19025 [Agrobacterium tumefaciens]|uniref:hypothetical protein n=1 Tax=Agrobacterium tumefaciens TaxID=358 RepID=UPI001574973F|nr:hypothetical protein [Agrobacterium tumefaciens]NTA82592.1 hypothetical protein [Agrobacterium tumefaciens]